MNQTYQAMFLAVIQPVTSTTSPNNALQLVRLYPNNLLALLVAPKSQAFTAQFHRPTKKCYNFSGKACSLWTYSLKIPLALPSMVMKPDSKPKIPKDNLAYNWHQKISLQLGENPNTPPIQPSQVQK